MERANICLRNLGKKDETGRDTHVASSAGPRPAFHTWNPSVFAGPGFHRCELPNRETNPGLGLRFSLFGRPDLEPPSILLLPLR